jgi:hypothetical protein
MGRFVKNAQIHTGSYAARVPVGTNSLGPTAPQNGQIRYNTDTGGMEIYIDTGFGLPLWKKLAVVGKSEIIKDSFVGDGTTVTFPMSTPYASGKEAEVMVFVGNVHQNPGVAYTFNGSNTVTFTSAPNIGLTIIMLHGFNSTATY